MFVILVYDVREKYLGKVLGICRKYLNWVQNSVFEGEITKSNLEKLKDELKRCICKEDSIIIYKLGSIRYFRKEILGHDKNPYDNII